MSASDTIATYALVVALAALAFTIGSFWWLSARCGKLQIVGEPRSYSFAATGELILNLPLVFTNTRPGAAVAINLRLSLDAPGFPSMVPFVATHKGVKPENESRKMATSIVVQGRETRIVCCEFISRPFDVKVEGSIDIPIKVEAYVVTGWWRWRHPTWRSLLTFPLRLSAEAVQQRGRYLTYDNQASD